jgi:hypothetical protein
MRQRVGARGEHAQQEVIGKPIDMVAVGTAPEAQGGQELVSHGGFTGLVPNKQLKVKKQGRTPPSWRFNEWPEKQSLYG